LIFSFVKTFYVCLLKDGKQFLKNVVLEILTLTFTTSKVKLRPLR